jgi:hypothetical protein
MSLHNPLHLGSGEWPHSRTSLRKISSTRRISSKCPSLKNFRPAFATIVDSPVIMQMSAWTPGSRSPSNRSRTPDLLKATTIRSQAFEWSKANWISWVTSLFENTSLLCLLLSNLGTRFCLRGVGCDALGF